MAYCSRLLHTIESCTLGFVVKPTKPLLLEDQNSLRALQIGGDSPPMYGKSHSVNSCVLLRFPLIQATLPTVNVKPEGIAGIRDRTPEDVTNTTWWANGNRMIQRRYRENPSCALPR